MTARAVEGLVAKWIDELVRGATESFDAGYNFSRRQCADDLKEALTADRAESGELPDGDWSRESMQFLAYRLRNMSAIGFDADTLTDAASWLEKLAARAASCGGGEVDQTFADWLATEMPAGTVIGNPQWWANRIARQYRVRTTPPTPSAGVEVPAWVTELVEAARGSLRQTEANQRDGLVPTIYYETHQRLERALTAALEGGK